MLASIRAHLCVSLCLSQLHKHCHVPGVLLYIMIDEEHHPFSFCSSDQHPSPLLTPRVLLLWPLLDFKPPIGVLPDSPSSFSCVILPRASLSLLLWGEKSSADNRRTRPPWPAWVTVLSVFVSSCLGWHTVGLEDPQALLALFAPPSGPETSVSLRPVWHKFI